MYCIRYFLYLKRHVDMVVYHLRTRSYGLKLSAVQSSFSKKNFIYRLLYTEY